MATKLLDLIIEIYVLVVPIPRAHELLHERIAYKFNHIRKTNLMRFLEQKSL